MSILMRKSDSCEQRADHSGHPPFRNRAATQTKLRSLHQFANFGASLRMERRSRSRHVRNSGNQNLPNVGAVGVLKKYHGRINVFGKLLAADGHTARVLDGAEQ